jgi:hypothetical protein
MGGYGYMDQVFKHLLRMLVLISLLFIFGCATTEVPITDATFNNNYQTNRHYYNSEIGKVQSKLVNLTVECYKGSADACAKAEALKMKLKGLLND